MLAVQAFWSNAQKNTDKEKHLLLQFQPEEQIHFGFVSRKASGVKLPNRTCCGGKGAAKGSSYLNIRYNSDKRLKA